MTNLDHKIIKANLPYFFLLCHDILYTLKIDGMEEMELWFFLHGRSVRVLTEKEDKKAKPINHFRFLADKV